MVQQVGQDDPSLLVFESFDFFLILDVVVPIVVTLKQIKGVSGVVDLFKMILNWLVFH